MPAHASQAYAGNISALVQHLVRDGKLTMDFADEIVKSSCLTHEGRILQP